MFEMNKKISAVDTSCNARSSTARKRVEGKKYRYKRGTSKYFLYIQERFADFYCLIMKSVLYPDLKDNFRQDNLVKVDKDIGTLKSYLSNLMDTKQKSITFSPNSLRFPKE